jgi:hypothetical protein
MPVVLIGEVVNSGDAATGYVADTPNISTDDDFVEGTGAVGIKASGATVELYTTAQGSTSPYDFSSTGNEFGYHVIMWFNSKTPLNTTPVTDSQPIGMTVIFGDGTSAGKWNVFPNGFYKGGFITNVIDPSKDFDNIVAGTWTVGANPGQLTAVDRSGGGFTTITTIMGNFNNVQLDQWTIGLGVRVEDGTFDFEDVRAEDEDNNFWGWWSSKNGQIVAKGKLFIGPHTGSTATTFDSLAESVVFADERVAEGCYEIDMRGAGTDVIWELFSLTAATGSARWSINVSSSCNLFSDTNGVWSNGDIISLWSNSHLTGTSIISTNKFFQSGSTMDGVTVLSANTSEGEAFIVSDDISLIQNSAFEYSAGHALEIPPSVATPVTYSFSANTFTNYLADDTSGSAIFNNSGGPVLINISNGLSPTVRNSFGSTTDVQNPVVLTLTNIVSGSEVRILSSSQTPPVELDGTQESGTEFTFNYTFATGFFIDIVVLELGYKYLRLSDVELGASDTSIPVQQQLDRVYNNP